MNIRSAENSPEHGGLFDIVLKVAERCNLACPYCYYFKESYDANKREAFMSDEVLAELPRFLLRSVEKLNLRQLNVGLHGGEPLLMKKPKADRLCTEIRQAVGDKVDLHFSVQTNGVLIDEEWIGIFEKHHVDVGVSIDGPRELHDSKRPTHGGRGSYDGAVRGLRLLQKAVAEGRLRSAGLLCVLHAVDDSAGLLEHFVKELGVDSPNLNFPRGGWDLPYVLEWDKSVESHRKLVRYWLDELIYPHFSHIRGLSDVFFALLSDVGALRNDRWVSRRHFITSISSEGTMHIDDNVMGVDKSLTESELSIWGNSLADFIQTALWQKLHLAVDQKPAECDGCEWFRTCRGGHLFNRFSSQSGFDRKSAICETMKMIHEEIVGFLVRKGVVTLEELGERLASPPLATAERALKMMVGKNACPIDKPLLSTAA